MDKILDYIQSNLPPEIKKLHYLVVNGSRAYGCHSPTSDYDLYGFATPQDEYIYPNLQGVYGFTDLKNFDQWEFGPHTINGKEFSCVVYNITKYYKLCKDCNPNMLDSLYAAQYDDCVVHMDEVGKNTFNNRSLFLSKKLFHTLTGFSNSQRKKILNGVNANGKRKTLIDTMGFDTKYSAHLVRAILECRDWLRNGDCDLRKHAKITCDIREGKYTKQECFDMATQHENECKELYDMCDTLPMYPRIKEITKLLKDNLGV